jgi:hypothetical protein
LGLVVAGAVGVACAGNNTRAVTSNEGCPDSGRSVSSPANGAASAAPVAADPGRPIASYSFDEASGSYATEARTGAQAPIYLAARVPGPSGNALGFGASSARAELFPVGSFARGGISVELWVRPHSLAPDKIAHLIGDGGGGMESFRVQLRGGKVVLVLATDDGSPPEPVVTSNRSLELERWQLVTVTYDGTTARVYLDGVEDVAKPVMFPVQVSANTLLVGALRLASDGRITDQFDGAIDEIKIWDRTVPAEAVAEHFHAFE